MTIWMNEPPTDRTHLAYQILRTPPNKKINMVSLSHQPIGTMLHYWRGRSTPCNMQTCEACKAGQRPRWKGYLYVCPANSRRILIFEYTERVHNDLLDQLSRRKSLFGLVFSAIRLGTRPNSPLHLDFTDTVIDPAQLPTPDNLEEILERMWEVRQQPLPQFSETDIHADLKNGAPPR